LTNSLRKTIEDLNYDNQVEWNFGFVSKLNWRFVCF